MLIVEQSDGTDWASAAALERKADEPEATLADELVEIAEPLHVGEAKIAADVMYLEVIAPPAFRGSRLRRRTS